MIDLHAPHRVCPGCPEKTPTCTLRYARRLAASLMPEERQGIVDRCAKWLLTKHPGVTIASGRTSDQPYDEVERALVATELYALEWAPCPFRGPLAGCALHGAFTPVDNQRENHAAHWGWLPTLLLKALEPEILRALVRDRLVADAKVAVLTLRSNFPPPRWSTNQPFISPSLQAKEVINGPVSTTVQSRAD